MRKRHLVTPLVLAGGLLISGCGPQGAYNELTDSYAKSECSASTDHPGRYPTTNDTGVTVEREHNSNFIAGSVWINCDPTPIQHILDVELWYHPLTGSEFKLQAKAKFTDKPPKDDYLNYDLIVPCKAGIYEVRWSVVGRDNEGEPYTYSDRWKYAFVKNIDCDEDPGPSTQPSPEGGPVVLP